MKLHIKKGDFVFVNTGDYKGQQGRILEVNIKKQKAIVEGINLVSKHTKPNSKHPKGGIIEKEALVHISNLMLVDSSTGTPSRIGRKKNNDGILKRYYKKSGKEV